VIDSMPKETSTVPTENDKEVFVEFYYREIKDLCKHFLTLISATLVASITFGDKIVPFSTATSAQRWTLSLSWLALLAALAAAGWGLYLLFTAAEKAKGEVIFTYGRGFKELARLAAFFLDFSALAYGGGLLLLAAAGMLRLFQHT